MLIAFTEILLVDEVCLGFGYSTELDDLMAWTSVHPLSLFGVWL
jgi:hypothetical protein